ncbi:MAG: serine/threonine-protein kinase [Pirellulaceae bacterium]
MKTSLHGFAQNLIDSGLLTTAELDAFLDSLATHEQPADADTLSAKLVERSLLSAFQAKCLGQGMTKGLVLGEYVVVDEIGQGGMGCVLKARHRRMDREVALKVISFQASKMPKLLERFEREVRTLARLNHPNVVTAFDAGEQNGVVYLAMELVEGRDLEQRVRQNGPASPREAVDLIMQAAQGLAYAHRMGVVHRDVKPRNLLLRKDGVVKVLDLGLARLCGPLQWSDGERDGGLTDTGMIVGTVDYMSPEQALDSKHADQRADIYSLGCTLHFLLTGHPPYGGATLAERLKAHREAPLPDLENLCGAPPLLQIALQRTLAKSPEDRHPSMEDLIADLQRLHLLFDSSIGATRHPSFSEAGFTGSIGEIPPYVPAVRLDVLAKGTPKLAGDGRPSPRGAPNIPGYEVLEEVGRGGMGIVYKARQLRANRLVALKTTRLDQFADAQTVLRFQAEAKAAGKLHHPGIVAIYEVGEADRVHYYSMAYVEGRTLSERVAASGPYRANQAAWLVKAIAEAITYAHGQGVIHRDIKPGNVLLDSDGCPQVTDFGLAKRLESETQLTDPGACLGTPEFMSPEQAEGRADQVTAATDIYGLGAVLYFLLAGRPPFVAENRLTLARLVCEAEPPPLASAGIPRDLERVCLKCLAKRPQDRYSSAGDLVDDLARFLRSEPVLARPVGWLGRCARWSQQPERIWEVGVLTLLLSVVFCFWNVAGIVALLFRLVPSNDPLQSASVVAIDCLGFVLCLAIGWKTMAGRPWALWSGLATGLAIILFSAGCLSNVIGFQGGGWLAEPAIRVPVFLFFAAIGLLMTFGYAIALAAFRSRTRREWGDLGTGESA